MASPLDKYKKQTQKIGADLKREGIELEDSSLSEAGKDNVNVAGGYEHLNNDQQETPPNNERLKTAWYRAREENPDIEQTLSQVQEQEQENEL